MKYRKLGRTGLNVSEIGLGTEYLNRKPRETVVSVIHKAINKGINYFDVVFAFKEYRENLAAAFKGHRDKIIIAGHIGCAETNGHYRLSRDVKENEKLFLDLLKRLQTDYVDIVMIQMVNEMVSYENVMKEGGVMDLALRFKKEGKARFIGVSGHKIPAIKSTLESGKVDVVMFPINITWDCTPGRKEIYHLCAKNKTSLVAMKIFAGGRIFNQARTPITTTQCINYALSQKGVCTVVPGPRNLKELNEILAFLPASEKEKAFGSIIEDAQEELKGNCVYCNHCQPCPQGIDIGSVISRLDRAQCGRPAKSIILNRSRLNFYFPGRIRLSRENFKGLKAKAAKCTECDICMKRCPFEVDVISKMKQAVKLFENR